MIHGKGKNMSRITKRFASVALAGLLTVSGMMAAPGMVTQAKTMPKVTMSTTEQGAYKSYHAVPDKTFMYEDDGELHVVAVIGTRLTDYTISRDLKVEDTEKVTLPRYEVWGGYFHSEKGQHYVAIGYNNAEQSNSKAVIKVIKYNEDWKKTGMANIPGSVSNQYPGVSSPFASGNVSFDEYQNTLYMMTSRTTFKTSDGASHQSNIAFAIDTRSMKAAADNVSYCSHSFNQLVKFRDGSLYAVDHGDAYPRGVKVTIFDDYGKATTAGRRGSVTSFAFKGEIGNNSTGATVGGLEISNNYALVTGTAQPHGSSIGGVSGFANGYGQNLYLIKRSRSTGDSTVKWLTAYNPTTSGVTVDCPRFVKVNDNRFAILYSVRNVRTGSRIFHCLYIDGEGNKVNDVTFKDIQFRGGTQPIVFKNRIYFVEKPSNGAKTQIYDIPAK